MGKGRNYYGGLAHGEHLRQYIERIERLEDEKQEIAQHIKEVYAEAKGTGFDTKTMRQIVRLRKMSETERDEHEALLDLYKGALGMLNGTPLGEAALRRLEKKEEPKEPEEQPESDTVSEDQEQDSYSDATEPKEPTCTIEEAREMGTTAAKEGRPVSSNPFPARDPRRAAWDEAWCLGAGSDGMELPDAWRRKPKKDQEPE